MLTKLISLVKSEQKGFFNTDRISYAFQRRDLARAAMTTVKNIKDFGELYKKISEFDPKIRKFNVLRNIQVGLCFIGTVSPMIAALTRLPVNANYFFILTAISIVLLFKIKSYSDPAYLELKKQSEDLEKYKEIIKQFSEDVNLKIIHPLSPVYRHEFKKSLHKALPFFGKELIDKIYHDTFNLFLENLIEKKKDDLRSQKTDEIFVKIMGIFGLKNLALRMIK